MYRIVNDDLMKKVKLLGVPNKLAMTVHLTQSPTRNIIYTLCLWMLEINKKKLNRS